MVDVETNKKKVKYLQKTEPELETSKVVAADANKTVNVNKLEKQNNK